MAKEIIIKGARSNNLKNIDVTIPRDKLVVLSGLSGSGKSSLAFDTLYAEGHRRFVESLSSYARQFLGQLDKPDVDSIEGLSPTISIDQKTTSKNPRSTVGTVTEIYDYLRLLYARTGIPHCPICGKEISRQSVDDIIAKIMLLPQGERFLIVAPVVKDKKGMHEKVFEDARKSGFTRVRVDGSLYDLTEKIELDKNKRHDIEIVIDRLVMKPDLRSRVADSVENALSVANEHVIVVTMPRDKEPEIMEFSCSYACEEHGISFGELEPRQFSFNNPQGACPHCMGLGVTRQISIDRILPDHDLSLREGAIAVNGFKTLEEESWNGPLFAAVGEYVGFTLDMPLKDFSKEAYHALLYGTGDKIYFLTRYFGGESHETKSKFEGLIGMIEKRMQMGNNEYYEEFIEETDCPVCKGKRLNPTVLSVTVGGLNIDEFCSLSVENALEFMSSLKFEGGMALVAKDIVKEIIARLTFLKRVGLEYLTLKRKAGTLSGGEAQRIRLATQIGSSLVGVLYILDEPSIGLHQSDNTKLISTLKELRDIGNTVVVVEHDEETIEEADYVIDIGPGAGIHGGKLVFSGTPKELLSAKGSLTGDYLSGRKKIGIPKERRTGNGKFITIKGASQNNLKHIDVDFPLGCFVCVSGVSGSGKSSLVNSILYPALASKLNGSYARPGKHDKILGIENVDKVIAIDQSPIGRTPRSNPATYTGLFSDIRELFASTKDAKARGYKSGRFSFNIKGGRCEACEGDGVKKIEMHFLPDVYVTCDLCKGKRYNSETLEVKYKGKNIFEVLDMTVEEGIEFFDGVPKIKKRLMTLFDVGLGYIKIGQSSTTLSGGEAQRVKLATELSRKGTGKTVYILDEPTTGLHTADVAKLIDVLQRLCDAGNTVIVIEHNMDVIKVADYIIDMGPCGGDNGGRVVCKGTPEQIAECEASQTGKYLKRWLNK